MENTSSGTREIYLGRTIIDLIPETGDEIYWSGSACARDNCCLPIPETTVFLTSNHPETVLVLKGILKAYHLDN